MITGVGWKLSGKLNDEGIQYVRDLWSYRKGQLQDMFGPKTGEQLFCHSRGEDFRKLQPVVSRKSIGVDVNWGVRFTHSLEVEAFLQNLSCELATRLQEAGYK